MKIKKCALFLVIIIMLLPLTACSKKCANGCGNAADSQCMADMCDQCCAYWAGLNGCYKSH